MKYIVHKRFRGKAIYGDMNIPALTECECDDGVIIKCNGIPICFVMSENSHQFFAVNDDGLGMERGKLTQAIQKMLSKRDNDYQKRWDKVWEDEVCRKYKRKEYKDYWLWNHDFYNADIETLQYIADLVGVKYKK